MNKLSLVLKLGAKYQHRGNKKYYKLLHIAKHVDKPNEQLVVYKALYKCPVFGKNSVWIRSMDKFIESFILSSPRHYNRVSNLYSKRI